MESKKLSLYNIIKMKERQNNMNSKRKHSKFKRLVITTGALLLLAGSPIVQNNPMGTYLNSMTGAITAQAAELTQSARWVGSGDRWQVSDNAGGYLKNTWFQDDVTGHWYLLGAEDGSVMYAGLVTDQSTGKTYLMNVSHDGTFGRMISTNGVYNINGKSISLTFNQNHDGTFGAITSGLSEVRNTGVTEKSLPSIPTADNTTTQTNNNSSTPNSKNIDSDGNKTGSDYDGMPAVTLDQRLADFDGDGKLTGVEYQTYKSMQGVEQEYNKNDGVHIS